MKNDLSIINVKKLSHKTHFIILNHINVRKVLYKKTLNLCVISIGYNDSQRIYVRNKKKFGGHLGVSITHYKLKKELSEIALKTLLKILNRQKFIHGIIIQTPIPLEISEKRMFALINFAKDVDGVNPRHLGLSMLDLKGILPCTPLGCMYLFKEERISIPLKNIVVMGKSNIVGKPLLHMLVNRKATVVSTHAYTKNITALTKKADILIVAIGDPRSVDKRYIKKNVIILDIGINCIKNNRIVGDVDIKSVIKDISRITPVPGGMGALTVSMVFYNITLLQQDYLT
jgi:methylenetetrahydrofolate dehydrogenase (NADP+)/methenyltetrahydrofolate cyclohydrolase